MGPRRVQRDEALAHGAQRKHAPIAHGHSPHSGDLEGHGHAVEPEGIWSANIGRDEEDRGRQSQALENRCDVGEVVAVAVVEGESERVARGTPLLQAQGQLLHGKYVVMPGDVSHAGGEDRRRQRRHERVVVVIHPMEAQNGNPRSRSRVNDRASHRSKKSSVVERAGHGLHRRRAKAHDASPCR